MSGSVKIPVLQFRGNSILFYEQYLTTRRLEENVLRMERAREFKAYSGDLTDNARKRLTKAITLLVYCSPERVVIDEISLRKRKFKLSFITLTVASSERNLSGREAHKLLLEPFLLVMRRKFGVKLYVWKAELQKRGQIHYHITTNQYILHTKIRNEWNNLQYKAGLLEGYFQKYGHYDPNSTDIHSVRKVKNLESYLVKYVAKSSGGDIGGKVWDCSAALKKAAYFCTELDSIYAAKINELVKTGAAAVVETDFCRIVKFKDSKPTDVLNERDSRRFAAQIAEISGGSSS